jgi:hypothetical protein
MNDSDIIEPAKHNDALIFGAIDPDLLSKEIEVSISPHGSKTMPGRWKPWKTTVQGLVDAFSKHETGVKDGRCFLSGAVIDGQRRANSVPHLSILALDLDTGESLYEMHDKIVALGLFGILYSTHSDGKDSTEIKKDAVVKHCNGDTNPNLEQVCSYLTEVKRYRPEVLKNAELLGTEHTADGIVLKVRHAPMEKFRVVLVLKDRFVVAERGGTQQQALQEFRERYFGVSKLLGAYCDRATSDVSRLFYTPRSPKGSTSHVIEIIAGAPLDLETVERITQDDLRREGLGAFEQALGAAGGGREYKTDGLLWFLKKYGDAFDAAEFFTDVEPEGDRGPTPSGMGRTHRCPNCENHTSGDDPEDKGFYCVNGVDSSSGQSIASCRHDSCSMLDRANFIDMACEHAGITSADGLMKWVPKLIEEEKESEKDTQTSDEPKSVTYSNTIAAKRAIDDESLDPIKVAVSIGMSGFKPDVLITLKDLWVKGKHGKGPGEWNTLIKQGQNAVKKTTRDDGGMESDTIAQLGQMNREYAVVFLGADIRIMEENGKGESPQFRGKDGFVTYNASRKVELKNDEGDIRMVPLTKAWFEWPDTRRYKKVVFEPSGCRPDWCNLWRGFPIEPKKGDWSMLRTHVFENICLGNMEYFNWLMTWKAQIMQFPGIKMGSAVVVRGPKGSGKSRLFDFFRAILGETSLKVSHRDHITNQFNAHQQGLVLMVAEEAFWAGDTSAGGILKDLITSNQMLMTPKGIDSQPVSNYMRLAMVSNEKWVVPAGFEDERRFFVLQTNEARRGKQHTQFWDDMTFQMEHKGGLEAMAYDLIAWKPTMFPEGWNTLRHPPQTPWLTDQARESMTISEKFFLKLVTDGGMQVANRPDGLMIRDLVMHEDQENYLSKKDVDWFYENFILKSNAGRHKFGDAALLKELIEEWLLAEPARRSRKTNEYLPADRENSYRMPSLKVIRQNLVERKHISFEEVVDEDDDDALKAA